MATDAERIGSRRQVVRSSCRAPSCQARSCRARSWWAPSMTRTAHRPRCSDWSAVTACWRCSPRAMRWRQGFSTTYCDSGASTTARKHHPPQPMSISAGWISAGWIPAVSAVTELPSRPRPRPAPPARRRIDGHPGEQGAVHLAANGHRRLIALRRAYGVANTAQLVSRSRSLGVIDSSDRTRR